MYIMMILMLMACASMVGSEASDITALSESLKLVQSAGEAAQKLEIKSTAEAKTQAELEKIEKDKKEAADKSKVVKPKVKVETSPEEPESETPGTQSEMDQVRGELVGLYTYLADFYGKYRDFLNKRIDGLKAIKVLDQDILLAAEGDLKQKKLRDKNNGLVNVTMSLNNFVKAFSDELKDQAKEMNVLGSLSAPLSVLPRAKRAIVQEKIRALESIISSAKLLKNDIKVGDDLGPLIKDAADRVEVAKREFDENNDLKKGLGKLSDADISSGLDALDRAGQKPEEPQEKEAEDKKKTGEVEAKRVQKELELKEEQENARIQQEQERKKNEEAEAKRVQKELERKENEEAETKRKQGEKDAAERKRLEDEIEKNKQEEQELKAEELRKKHEQDRKESQEKAEREERDRAAEELSKKQEQDEAKRKLEEEEKIKQQEREKNKRAELKRKQDEKKRKKAESLRAQQEQEAKAEAERKRKLETLGTVESEIDSEKEAERKVEELRAQQEQEQLEEERKQEEQKKAEEDKQGMLQIRAALNELYRYLVTNNGEFVSFLDKYKYTKDSGLRDKILVQFSNALDDLKAEVSSSETTSEKTLLQDAQEVILNDKIRELSIIIDLIKNIEINATKKLAKLIPQREQSTEEYNRSASMMLLWDDQKILKRLSELQEKYEDYVARGGAAKPKKTGKKKPEKAVIEALRGVQEKQKIRELLIGYNEYLITQYQNVALQVTEAQERFLEKSEQLQKSLKNLKDENESFPPMAPQRAALLVNITNKAAEIKDLEAKHAAAIKDYKDKLSDESGKLKKEQDKYVDAKTLLQQAQKKVLQLKVGVIDKLIQLIDGISDKKIADIPEIKATINKAVAGAQSRIKKIPDISDKDIQSQLLEKSK